MKDPSFKKSAIKSNPPRTHTKYRTKKIGRVERKLKANKKI